MYMLHTLSYHDHTHMLRHVDTQEVHVKSTLHPRKALMN